MESTPLEQRLQPVFRGIVRRRWWILAIYALCLPLALLLALRVDEDGAIENMVVPSDPDVAATYSFQALFPERASVLVILESPTPMDRASLDELARLEQAINALEGVDAYSILTIWNRLKPRVTGDGLPLDQLEAFAHGSEFLRRQGLVGDDFVSVAASFDDSDSRHRDAVLAAITSAAAAIRGPTSPITRVRYVGGAWVDSWLERETAAASVHYFPIFGVFVVCLVYGLYRSARALVLILSCLATAVLLGMAFGGAVGYAFTVVSGLIPLTLLVTNTASLVYLHSRFVDQPPERPVDEHRIHALANKFLAVSASVFAAAVGFAALTVSQIRPIRELGVWTASGLLLGWLVCFTLYPALQAVLRPPTRRKRRVAGTWMIHIADALPFWSYRWRWVLLTVSAVLAVAGAASLFGIPGLLPPMQLETDALHYVDPDIRIAADTRWFSDHVLGTISAQLWITTPTDGVVTPEVVSALDQLTRQLEREPDVGAVVGLPAILRLRRYAALGDDRMPTDLAARERAATELEQLLFSEPALQSWVDLDSLAATYLTVTTAAATDGGYRALEAAVDRAWRATAATDPVLGQCSWRMVGSGLLQDTIASHLVPTLTESFAITFAVIFMTFLVVFRSGAARLNAMVPSLFSILVTFLVMRLTGIPLNVATILIATTVLGATENDQIHFFYHFGEARRHGSTHFALAHSIRVAGHAIFFATMINAGGFMALALSDLPPMRQFGMISALAFVLALVADFSFLPAALWVFFRERPDGYPEAKRRNAP